MWLCVLKIPMPAASIGQQKGYNSLRQFLTAHCTTNPSNVEWIGLLSFASPEILIWPLANLGFPGGLAGKESASNAENLYLIAGLGISPGEGNSYPLQNYGLENAMDYSHKESDMTFTINGGFHGGSDSSESACSAGHPDSIPELGKSRGEGNGNPLQYSWLENPHGQRSLAGYSPWRRKESDTTERLHFHFL